MCGYDMIVACNAMLAKKCNATIWLTLSKLLGKKMQCHKGQLVGYDTNGGEYKGCLHGHGATVLQ
jgi:hypothetical protein